MKTFKTILGFILILFGTITIIQVSSEEKGAGLFGAFTAYVVILGISSYLLYSAHKNQRKIKTSKKISQQNQNIQRDFSTNEQKIRLQILKDKGVLTEIEYQEKIEILNKKDDRIKEERLLNEIKRTDEYKNLYQLLENEILTKKEFESKVKFLIEKDKKQREIICEAVRDKLKPKDLKIIKGNHFRGNKIIESKLKRKLEEVLEVKTTFNDSEFIELILLELEKTYGNIV